MIASGEKLEEYRDQTKYWERRLKGLYPQTDSFGNTYYPIIETIIFSNGYSKDRRQIEVEFISARIGYGNPEWGAKKGVICNCILLGKVLEKNY